MSTPSSSPLEAYKALTLAQQKVLAEYAVAEGPARFGRPFARLVLERAGFIVPGGFEDLEYSITPLGLSVHQAGQTKPDDR
jgi:hypothetical protein